MSSKIKYVYIAGPLRPKCYHSNSLWIDYLLNVNQMTKYARKVIKLGFTPFCPCLDFLYVLVGNGKDRPTEATIMRLSKDWLEKCDAILLIPGWRRSEGTLAEIKLAEKLNIPVFKTLEELNKTTEG